MKEKLKIIRKSLFALPLKDANFSTRKFAIGEQGQDRLELVAKVVVAGYNLALETGYNPDLLIHQSMISRELQGFFTEGIGMGLYTLDLLSPLRSNSFWRFVESEGANHRYMSYIGAGIACGVFNHRPIETFRLRASPTSGLLILNGIGFYYAYFKPQKGIERQFIPKDLTFDDFYIECYDNGMGRAFWFVNGGNPDLIANMIFEFSPERQGSIWAGVGLAATYAGGVDKNKIEKLIALAGKHAPRLGEGSVLATHTRDVAGNKHELDLTERLLTGKSAAECQEFACNANQKLNNQSTINGKHSLQVFLEEIREWVALNQAAIIS
ncbi:hypothetical protein QE382_004375 [Sphingobacterium zeae]|uniref:DUF1702 family protein n=1 Tax=Sphingobacterium zeae TaxID=1776859 RepID=A0ABU0UC32_9SPHI|nr:DUF1702 family protein [Sphingobacterium zeae]MDQ1152391.1 hypothetical protein [Sphingobacterium zeae]